MEAAHIDGLRNSLNDPDNTRLFACCYSQACRAKDHLRTILSEYRADVLDTMTLTILDNGDQKAIGGTVLQSVPSPPTTEPNPNSHRSGPTVNCAL